MRPLDPWKASNYRASMLLGGWRNIGPTVLELDLQTELYCPIFVNLKLTVKKSHFSPDSLARINLPGQNPDGKMPYVPI